MATLGQLYSNGDSGVTVKKTHMVPLDKIYINADETLKLVFEKLQQTMEIVRNSGWQ